MDIFRNIFENWPVFSVFILSITLLTSTGVFAQDDIPTTKGFSGFILAGPGYFKMESNRVVTGAPLLDYVANNEIQSLETAPSNQTASSFAVVGEINYTFDSSRTQLFFGNRLEDVLRLDVAFGLGIRHEIRDSSILAMSLLFTPLDLQMWSDPYVIGKERISTQLNVPGIRIRWGRILKTGLEFTFTARQYRFEDEKSGHFLVSNGLLTSTDQELLIRNGFSYYSQVVYRLQFKKHRFEPTIKYNIEAHSGQALANTSVAIKLSYLYISPKIIVDLNIISGQSMANEIHPVFNKRLETKRLAFAWVIIIPVKVYKTSRLNVFIGGEIFREEANIDFFDTSIDWVNAGIIWRHLKK